MALKSWRRFYTPKTWKLKIPAFGKETTSSKPAFFVFHLRFLSGCSSLLEAVVVLSPPAKSPKQPVIFVAKILLKLLYSTVGFPYESWWTGMIYRLNIDPLNGRIPCKANMSIGGLFKMSHVPFIMSFGGIRPMVVWGNTVWDNHMIMIGLGLSCKLAIWLE